MTEIVGSEIFRILFIRGYKMLSLMNVDVGSITDRLVYFFEYAKAAFLGFTFTDAIDILLLTVFFFFIFHFFRSRKTGTLILGITICLAVFIISTVFDLTGIRFILAGIFQIGALALVVIFQPEIRDFLERVGAGSISSIRSIGESKNKDKYYNTIENICRAVHVLSVEKTGALIVIERTTKLDEVLKSGTLINADVNDSLIRNLFYNKAPLHDGALVIEDGRIAAAACILPLPKRTYVDIDLGTRHRAAVGLSETSDAIIIVVSEETGTISVANECELIRNFTSDTLRKYLVKELIREDRNESNK